MEIIDGIGVLKELKHGTHMNASTLFEGRGVIIFSRVGHAIRVEVIPGDGLPNYYFDMQADALDCLVDTATSIG